MIGDIPSYAAGDDNEDGADDDHCHDVGLRRFHEVNSSIGQVMKRAAISQALMGLCPVAPTTAPMKDAAAMASKKRASPSFCSLLYLECLTVMARIVAGRV